MPVDPIIKQDLMLIKEAFENKALEQEGRSATLVPFVETLSSSRQMHEVIRNGVERYPSANVSSTAGKHTLLDKLQDECVNCDARIRALGDLDLDVDLFPFLITFNDRAIESLIQSFSMLRDNNKIQQDLCSAYKLLRSQCVPDLRRLIQVLAFMIADLRSISKGLKSQLLQLLGVIVGQWVVSSSLNLDMYTKMITNTLRCVVADLNLQIKKLEPILSREGFEHTMDSIGDSLLSKEHKLTNITKDTTWFRVIPGNFSFISNLSQPTYTAPPEYTGKKIESFENLVNSGIGRVEEIITGVIEEGISGINTKLELTNQEFLKVLKISDNNLSSQISKIKQILLIQNLIDIVKTILSTRGDYNPCGVEAGRKFFTKIRFPGQDVRLINRDNENGDGESDTEVLIVPPTISITNPIVKDILEEHGVYITNTGSETSAAVSIPVSIRLSKCLDGKQ